MRRRNGLPILVLESRCRHGDNGLSFRRAGWNHSAFHIADDAAEEVGLLIAGVTAEKGQNVGNAAVVTGQFVASLRVVQALVGDFLLLLSDEFITDGFKHGEDDFVHEVVTLNK